MKDPKELTLRQAWNGTDKTDIRQRAIVDFEAACGSWERFIPIRQLDRSRS